jgi:hypothetical protein
MEFVGVEEDRKTRLSLTTWPGRTPDLAPLPLPLHPPALPAAMPCPSHPGPHLVLGWEPPIDASLASLRPEVRVAQRKRTPARS